MRSVQNWLILTGIYHETSGKTDDRTAELREEWYQKLFINLELFYKKTMFFHQTKQDLESEGLKQEH